MIVGGVEMDNSVVYALAAIGLAVGLYASTQAKPQSTAKRVESHNQEKSSKKASAASGKKNKKKSTTNKPNAGVPHVSDKVEQPARKAAEKVEKVVEKPAQKAETQKKATKSEKPAKSTKTQSQQPAHQPTKQPAKQSQPAAKLNVTEFNDLDAGEWTAVSSKKKSTTPSTEKPSFIEEKPAENTQELVEDAWDHAPKVDSQTVLNPSSDIYKDGDWTWSENTPATTNTRMNAPVAENSLLKTTNSSVDDMLDKELDTPENKARVMRITKETKQSAKPDDGWTMAGSKKAAVKDETPQQVAQQVEQEQTKKQRQNAKKQQAKNDSKTQNENERQERLRQHRQTNGAGAKPSGRNPWEVLASKGDSDLIWD
ncbi:hypothetical protein E3Q19_00806 [Wallemia mellicola]|nr:hypothetical protein E3Q19_00806 [Wallemia mellicola]